MSRVRVQFRLSMDRRWSGSDRNYSIVRTMQRADAEALAPAYFHRWDDGWAARITVSIVAPGARLAKSDGFCGYDWMVDNIVRYGSPYTTGTADRMTGSAAPA